MTRDQIKAELRRSAMEDTDPWQGVKLYAFLAALEWRHPGVENFNVMSIKAARMFFLLVAEAL